jgi:hypothetical protein
MGIVREARAFRDAIGEWTKEYAARRRVALLSGQVGADADVDLRRWSRRRFVGLASEATTPFCGMPPNSPLRLCTSSS